MRAVIVPKYAESPLYICDNVKIHLQISVDIHREAW